MAIPLLFADASTLLNFLNVGRFDLIEFLGYQVQVVDVVYEEIRSMRAELDLLIEEGKIQVIAL
jgi:predicted nucleic acid-binding protein